MISYTVKSNKIISQIFIPKYYDPNISSDLGKLSNYNLYRVKDLVDNGDVTLSTGHEIGKMSYGTGDIPFVRTSDISNWEIKSAPKQGVSEDIYSNYSEIQDIREGDILLVRDGTYLIGTNCFITELDEKILYQSHIIKIRINNQNKIPPSIFFVALNSKIVQRQIRSKQFTADIIDTLGKRFEEVLLPIPTSKDTINKLSKKIDQLLKDRVHGKAFIKQCPTLIEKALLKNSHKPLDNFFDTSLEDLKESLIQDTVTAEFGNFESFWIKSDKIKKSIYLPKYYAPSIEEELERMKSNCDLISLGDLKKENIISYYTGDEIGKMSYGTGNIPFVRTSDFSNWEIKHNPKQGISEDIFSKYTAKQDVRSGDIFIVRDGTYLVGSSCIVTKEDEKCLFCGGIYKIRSLNKEVIDEWLLLGLLNSYIFKRQIRTKQFTRDVIDTIGNRIDEIILPIPKNSSIKQSISKSVENIVSQRVNARNKIKELINAFATLKNSE